MVDFRDVALALAALDRGTGLEELTRLAFEVPREEKRGLDMAAVLTPPRSLCGILLTVASR